MKLLCSFLRKTAVWILLSPLALGFLGAAANEVVIASNHGKFPVMWNTYRIAQYGLRLEKAAQSDDADEAMHAQFDLEALQAGYIDDEHVLMTKQTHLNFLADWIDLRDATYSPGDLLMLLSEWLWGFAPVTWVVVVVQRLRKVVE